MIVIKTDILLVGFVGGGVLAVVVPNNINIYVYICRLIQSSMPSYIDTIQVL